MRFGPLLPHILIRGLCNILPTIRDFALFELMNINFFWDYELERKNTGRSAQWQGVVKVVLAGG